MPPKRRKPTIPTSPDAPAAPPSKRRATTRKQLKFPKSDSESAPSSSSPEEPVPQDDDSDESGAEWEDVLAPRTAPEPSNEPQGDLELTLDRSRVEPLTGAKKKGASGEERRIRMLTHCMHVQFLVFAGAVRNHWINDPLVQAILLSLLPPKMLRDVERYQDKARSHAKGKQKEGGAEEKDPALVKVLGLLMHWWKKKFRVTAPGIRKRGYKPLWVFENERTAKGAKVQFTTGRRDEEGREVCTPFLDRGETVRGVEGMRELAGTCEGSRDVGAQLFTGLCRALGFEAKLVYSLQPLGFGFTAAEEARVEGETPVKGKGKERVVTESESESGLTSLSSDSEGEVVIPKHSKSPEYGRGLKYPSFWTEVYSPIARTCFAIDPLVLTILGATPSTYTRFEPRGRLATAAKQHISYILSYSSDHTARDVTTRYLTSHALPGKTKGLRVPIREVPIYTLDNTIIGTQRIDWFGKVLRGYTRPQNRRTEADDLEDAELAAHVAAAPVKPKFHSESISGYKTHPSLILERHLHREEALRPGAEPAKHLTTGKGPTAKQEPVYRRADVLVCKAVENWYREGRALIPGAQPRKMVKRRAVTLTRKREIEASAREGETVMQGLYSLDQTELYKPPPIEDGRIPRNAFGNIDVYVPSMIPEGAVHVPLKGAPRVARGIGIDYAEAVTGFEFKKQRAVPFVEGVVVATENEGLLRDAWWQAERVKREKEEAKREKAALDMWRKWVVRLRVLKRLREDYGDEWEATAEGENPFVRKDLGGAQEREEREEQLEGGYLRDDHEGGFLREDHENAAEPTPTAPGGFILDIEPHEQSQEQPPPANGTAKITSLQSLFATSAAAVDNHSASSGEDEEDPNPGIRSEYFTNPKPTPRLPARKAASKRRKEEPVAEEDRTASTPMKSAEVPKQKIVPKTPIRAARRKTEVDTPVTAASTRPKRQAADRARRVTRGVLQKAGDSEAEEEEVESSEDDEEV